MKQKPLWTVSITTLPESEEAVSELLERLFQQGAVAYTDVETGRTMVTVYLESPVKTSLRKLLGAGLSRIRKCGLQIGPGRISIRKIAGKDWAESWKRHFKPIRIGRVLLVKPSWSKLKARKGEATVILDPGLSFGTGQHPTTSFCLQKLAAFGALGKSFLDIGTGSGILAIAAVKLGYAPVDAFDFDPDAVRIARGNFRRNCGNAGGRFFQADLTRLPKRSAQRYDLICANLISTLLLAERERILARLKPGGILILAGILGAEFKQVANAYRSAGLKLIASHSEKEWRSGAFLQQH